MRVVVRFQTAKNQLHSMLCLEVVAFFLFYCVWPIVGGISVPFLTELLEEVLPLFDFSARDGCTTPSAFECAKNHDDLMLCWKIVSDCFFI